MTYFCKDCSYRGTKGGQGGQCPACGSFNITNRPRRSTERPPPGKGRLVLLVALWGFLIGLISWKLSH